MNVFSSDYVEDLLEKFTNDPNSVPAEWQAYFSNLLSQSTGGAADPSGSTGAAATASSTSLTNLDQLTDGNAHSLGLAQLQDRVDQLVRGYRVRGHLSAKIDPLRMKDIDNPELSPEFYGLLPHDLEKKFSTRTINGTNVRKLDEILQQMRSTYCRYIGVQFMHIDDHHVRDWLQQRMEGTENRISMSREKQLRILTRLTDAVIFEEFVRRKFVGAKTFSLEGAESLIPLLDLSLEKAGEHGIRNIVIGMAHRGRLNVLANILGKRAENIFWTFNDPDPESHRGAGDVLYHLGHSSDWTTSTNQNVHLSLCFNPSHLEFVNPVALGRCRAKQDRDGDQIRGESMTLLIHGDAAFAGEGVVQETLNLSELPGYTTGGTLHVIVNNQIGFTTPMEEGRSTTYASDIAKMLQIPIFHVNGEDPESVAQVVELAMEFRKEFHRDVVIDMYCYRRLGHNESDEPRFTQPLMYKQIDERPTVRDSYLERLLKMSEISREEADEIAERRRQQLNRDFDNAKKSKYEDDAKTLEGLWEGYYGGPERLDDDAETGLPVENLSKIIGGIATVPGDFNLNPKLKRLMDHRSEMASGERPVDWATAELAAFGSLAVEGNAIRLSGQDCGRGTFSQRHAVLSDSETGGRFCSLQFLSDDQASVEIINSPLSETGVLGFDYGYSLDSPDKLVIWEAQFGDFWNAGQVIVDQFIASAEDKWSRLSGLVMLLPHGFEGAGPEHSSARIERFLLLSAEHNMQICIPTTAAQHFHMLRRQIRRKWRKPLVVFTPKSLLREPMVMSSLEEMAEGSFQRTLVDNVGSGTPEKVLIGSGKVCVDMLKSLHESTDERELRLIRLEQLYPLPMDELEAALSDIPEGTPVYWVQEEPLNMGAWPFIRVNFGDTLFGKWPLRVICRPESASPSTGSKKTHKIEQDELIDHALNVPGKALIA
ncbi:MAG: 2-oxoglutarate dehydrogenase E1 component [Planctomycetota bacterium]|nr:2-oxoglutarate dehydrogenase E1 component [Planctomycetota bacterium]